ncbi:MAG TPA: fibronectin type III domain-containing protein [Bacteroidales bacterium]|nr:fibronectin type III domain-containing protein [Bacteroidales bacterium]
MRFAGILFLSIVSFSTHAQENIFNIIFRDDFEENTTGVYRYIEWKRDWNAPAYVNNLEQTYIVASGEGNKAMKWVFPKGSVGPGSGGGQFEAPIETEVDEVYMSYNIKFRPGFEWVRGGKLPGLKGGPDHYNPGGPHPAWEDGFSNGLMWGHGYGGHDDIGGIYFYTYYQDMTGVYGESRRWGNFHFITEPEQWYNITIRMVMNTVRSDGSGGNNDGLMEGFVNGKLVASYSGLRFRNVSSVHIDKMKIYSFFGGSGPEFGAARDEWILLDDVCLFIYLPDTEVPRGNVPSQPGRTLKLPNMIKNYQRLNAERQTPEGPFNVRCLDITDSSLVFTWNMQIDSSTQKFIIYRNGHEMDTVLNSEYKFNNLLPGSKITFSVASLGKDGLLRPGDHTLATETRGLDVTPPTAPLNLSAVKISSNSIQLNWTKSSDNNQVTGYRIFVNGIPRGTSRSAEYIINGLSPKTNYNLAVTSVDQASNQSSMSETIQVTTIGYDEEAPLAPTSLVVQKKSERSIKISWSGSSDNVRVNGYVIFVDGMVRGTSYSPYYNIVGLSPGREYRISVAAFDNFGNKSKPSHSIRATTLK